MQQLATSAMGLYRDNTQFSFLAVLAHSCLLLRLYLFYSSSRAHSANKQTSSHNFSLLSRGKVSFLGELDQS